ncbi:PREDICTED: stimulator of interferon genes protein isoform X2 [Dinoponera quadriceps]|uniref:Stimulator of interferon genes protein isoform X2 n=1 Tax=Dinoponera quadriceps TaxID=609295 RepID=A0A6P3XN67_DINQU|nr:PREDICTED: stimulator of interferon genes protein isoform X2 [Dinoponera quadriceps]
MNDNLRVEGRAADMISRNTNLVPVISTEMNSDTSDKSVTSERRTNESPVFSLNDLKGLDYGTGMAYSYYYGYLRLVLPSSGTTSKGIVEKIENFEDTHNVSFPIHKLFILIPSSGYIPPNLKEMSDQWMESAKELEEERRNRAGNIRRTYHNNVYKIYPGGRKSGADPIYVVAEGASPLLTFYESELDTKDLCELIYYHDYKPDGTKVNVAKIILERIFQMTHT